MSLRAFAAILGVSATTALRDRKQHPGYAPGEDGAVDVFTVMGLDGKVRPSRRLDTSVRDALILELREAGQSVRKIAAAAGCSVGTVHRVVHKSN